MPTPSPSYASAWKSCIARSMDCTKMSNGGRTIWPSATSLPSSRPQKTERLLHRVRRRVLLAHNQTWTGQHRVHQVLDRGRHRRREEAALHRRAIARGEHLVALLEEPGARTAEQLVCLVQVLERRERQRALGSSDTSRSGVHTITSYRRQTSVDKPATTTTTTTTPTTPTPPPRSA
jgi:hypothetical protein